ncbi:MAG: hypothetical protein A2W17_02510 [Planctomycetes bacterium RBG_16_41_13]|nr:MAG: hypothetical protein A2W17_02510 [Planctomycetes bacterium RBG_16_41_13]
MRIKMVNRFMQHRIFISILWIVTVVFFFIIFLPLPGPINTGLDPSWQYAISYASSVKLAYGKDIIFTYGPLGYLIHGAVIDGNFWAITLFRCFIHFALFIVFVTELTKLYRSKKWINLSALILTIFLFYIFGAETDYAILFIFLIIIPYESSLNKKYHLVLYSLFMGAIAGFCLTTKFSLGICTIGSGILYYGGNIAGNIKQRKISVKYLYQLAVFTIVALWTTSIILDGLSKENASLVNYLKNYLTLSSGYSSAMSYAASQWEVAYALLQVILILFLLITTAKNKHNSIGYSACLAFVLWITFKHGFIRQDGHIVIFVKFIPLLVYLCLRNEVRLGRKMLFGHLVQHLTLLTLFIYLLVPSPFGQHLPNYLVSIKQIVSFTNFYNKLKFSLNLTKYKDIILKSSQENLSEMKLPSDVLKALQNKPLDIVPWEISLIPANNLTWQPRPVFQSYSAYTSSLDKINSESLVRNNPENILYHFSSIDKRHPFFDEPETFFNMFCNYHISSQFPDFISTEKLNQIIILERRKHSISSEAKKVNTFSMRWNEYTIVENRDKELVRAKIKIKYSMIGKMYKTLFRSPPVSINLTYADGQERSYRIIPENANNGVIISHLPRSSNEALRLFQGELPIQVKSFSFSNVNHFLYKPQIEGDLVSYRLLDSSIKQNKPLIDWFTLDNISFVSELANKYNGCVDNASKKHKIKHTNIISLNGWAVMQKPEQQKLIILITCDTDNTCLGMTETGDSRPDVSNYFKQSTYSNSGWSISLGAHALPKGVHDIKAWIYEVETNKAIPLNGVYKILIK